jgi:hypothetical protein
MSVVFNATPGRRAMDSDIAALILIFSNFY